MHGRRVPAVAPRGFGRDRWGVRRHRHVLPLHLRRLGPLRGGLGWRIGFREGAGFALRRREPRVRGCPLRLLPPLLRDLFHRVVLLALQLRLLDALRVGARVSRDGSVEPSLAVVRLAIDDPLGRAELLDALFVLEVRHGEVVEDLLRRGERRELRLSRPLILRCRGGRRLGRRLGGLLLAGVPQRLERVRVVPHGRLQTSNLPLGAIPRALRLRQPSAELLLDVRRARPQRPDRDARRLLLRLRLRSILLRFGRRRRLCRLPRLALRPRRRLRLPQLRLGRVPRDGQLSRARLQLPLLRLGQRDDALDLGVQFLAAFAALGVHRRVGSSNGVAQLAKLRLRRVRLSSQPLEFYASSSLSLSLSLRPFASNPVRRVRLGVGGEVPQGLHLRLQGPFASSRGVEGVGSLGANRVL
mmetsp:Transcript_14267/g.58067  ORF Transcript_14267/g.58067 Transcript_14267/m.58067 type:complete len:414 (-) Transcript_14267:1031-2272(-)